MWSLLGGDAGSTEVFLKITVIHTAITDNHIPPLGNLILGFGHPDG